MEGYVAAKRRILLNQGKGDTAVIGVDDPWGQRICTEITAANRRTIWPISAGRAMGRGVYALQGVLYDATGDRAVEVADLTRARSLPGRHNWQNAAAAYAAARGARRLGREDAVDGLMTFPGLAHRMETVASIGRVRFVNDSKATNADAARQAMSQPIRKVYWIAGGRPKAGGIDEPGRPLPARGQGLSGRRGRAGLRRARSKGKAAGRRCAATSTAAVAAAYADAAAARRGGDRAAVAGLRLLRPVRRLRGARRGLPRRREGAERRRCARRGRTPTYARTRRPDGGPGERPSQAPSSRAPRSVAQRRPEDPAAACSPSSDPPLEPCAVRVWRARVSCASWVSAALRTAAPSMTT